MVKNIRGCGSELLFVVLQKMQMRYDDEFSSNKIVCLVPPMAHHNKGPIDHYAPSFMLCTSIPYINITSMTLYLFWFVGLLIMYIRLLRLSGEAVLQYYDSLHWICSGLSCVSQFPFCNYRSKIGNCTPKLSKFLLTKIFCGVCQQTSLYPVGTLLVMCWYSTSFHIVMLHECMCFTSVPQRIRYIKAECSIWFYVPLHCHLLQVA